MKNAKLQIGLMVAVFIAAIIIGGFRAVKGDLQKIKSQATVLRKVDSAFIKARFSAQQFDSLLFLYRNCQGRADTLRQNYFLARKALIKIKKYNAICGKKPSQIKYLRGWSGRAINDYERNLLE